MDAQAQYRRLDELIDQVSALDALAQQVQVDDINAGAQAAKELIEAYDEWFAHCLSVLPADLRASFRFEYEGSTRSLQYRIKHFLQEPVKPRPKLFGGKDKKPSEFQGFLGCWQHPYAQRFQGPVKTQRQLLLEARVRLGAPAIEPQVAQHDSDQEDEMALPDQDRTVFVIHGRDKKARRGLFTFLRSIGLHPIEWAEALAETRQGSPKIGDVLQAVLSKGRAVIVLSTPDDVVQLKAEHADDEDDQELRPAGQARPNVIYETGMAMLLIPERTILVELGKVRRFTDLNGHFVVKLTNEPSARKLLAQRLQDIGCAVNLSGSDWLEAGDLTPPAVESTRTKQSPVRPVQSNDEVSDEDILLGNFTVTRDHTVYGEAYNSTTAEKHAVIKATFYDENGNIMGTANGVLNNLAPHKTKTFTLMARDDVAGYQNFKVEIDTMF